MIPRATRPYISTAEKIYSPRLMYPARYSTETMSTNNTYTAMPGYLPGAGYLPSYRPQSTGHPRLTYFITRNNGLPVPLIPADELPHNIKLQNVPRVLSPQETYGLQYVGCAPFSGAIFQLERESSAPMQRSNSQPPNDSLHVRAQSGSNVKQYLSAETIAHKTLSTPGVGGPVLPKRPISAADAAKSWRRPNSTTPPPRVMTPTKDLSTTDTTQAVIDAILRSEAGAETAERLNYRPKDSTPPPSGRIPDQEKKEYCTYWILHGDCAYVQQGCRYKHEMPDKAKLSEIGIKNVPRWWLEQNSAIKFGEKAIAGEKKSISEWLKVRKDSTSDDDESESESDDTPSESGSEAKKPVLTAKKPTTPVVGCKQIPSKPNHTAYTTTTGGSTSPIIPPARPSTPTPQSNNKLRDTSTTGSDLIDFAPLLPTPPSSTSSIPRSAPSENAPKATHTPTAAPPKTTKIFIPVGESPELHIADVKKRERIAIAKAKQQASSRNPSPASKKVTIATAPAPASAGPILTGLAASKHAPTAEEIMESEKKQVVMMKRDKAPAPAASQAQLKPTCRPRRAVVSAKSGEKKNGSI